MDKAVVGIYLEKSQLWDYPLSDDEYGKAYPELIISLMKRGVKPVLLRGKHTYKSGGLFSRHWVLSESAKGLDGFIEGGEIRVDVIYDKGLFYEFEEDAVPVLNHWRLSALCSNKWATYEEFPSLHPQTFLAKNKKELQSLIKRIKSDIIVVKELYGSGGEQVRIGSREETATIDYSYPVMVQEFVDSSGGINGIAEGMHDLRVILQNGKVISSYVRQPKPGGYRSNLFLGGSLIFIDNTAIPKKALESSMKIDAKLADNFPERLYSVDMMRSKSGKWYLVELNSSVGLRASYRFPTPAAQLRENLADQLVRMAKG